MVKPHSHVSSSSSTSYLSIFIYNILRNTLLLIEFTEYIIIQGTTALFQYLKGHPQILTNLYRPKELHFFDIYHKNNPPRRRFPNGTIYPEDVDAVFQKYMSYWNVTTDHDIRVTLEKTPMYMFLPHLAAEIKSVVPKAKIIMTLRDPIERALSQFKMEKANRFSRINKLYPDLTFDRCIEMDINTLNAAGVVVHSLSASSSNNTTHHTTSSSMDDYDYDWDKLDVAWEKYHRYDRYKHRCASVVGRGLYALQLRLWWKQYNKEERDKQLLIIDSDALRPDKLTGMIDMKTVTDFLDISEITNLDGTRVIHKGKGTLQLSNSTKERLRVFYEPFNTELKKMLGENWESTW